MQALIGRWVQIEGQPYPGLWFEFREDGTFLAHYDAMAIVSTGTYVIDDNFITLNQTSHTFGLVGQFNGRYAIDGKELKMSLTNTAGQSLPDDLSAARIYHKQD